MDKVRRAFRNLSIPKTFMVYMLLFPALAAILSTLTTRIAFDIENDINLRYEDPGDRYTLQNDRGEMLYVSAPYVSYTQEDGRIVAACNFVETWSIPIFFGASILAAALLFYRHKLKRPIELLRAASGKIAGNDLDFTIRYDRRDEMGRLCASFETMRAALLENNRILWRTAEERKRLNAAFAHDLRTPLTVLKGYTDLLTDCVAQEKIGKQQTITALSTMTGQIARLENYVQTMSEAQRVDDFRLALNPIPGRLLAEQIRSTAAALSQEAGRSLDFEHALSEATPVLDCPLVGRALDNVLSNAVRYAKTTVSVRCRMEGETLVVTVEDDGPGFAAEALQKVCAPYYTSEQGAAGNHVGIGLYIGKALCRKHGGDLQIRNAATGGAQVTASFFCGQPDLR